MLHRIRNAARRPAAAALALVAGAAAVLMPQPAAAAPPGAKDVTAVLFEWRYDSVAAECRSSLGPAGYGYVQVPPPQEHIQGPQWWTSYQPVGYRIAGRLGDRTAFADMVAACHGAGVKVVVDTVINHMASGSGTGTGGSSYTKYDYPGTYSVFDFDDCTAPVSNYADRWNVQHCELVGLADLDTGEPYVRGRIAAYLDDLLSLGVDGFRIDAAKHIPADDLADIKSRLSDPHAYWKQEAIYGAGEAVSRPSTKAPATYRSSATPATSSGSSGTRTSPTSRTTARAGATSRPPEPRSSSTTTTPSAAATPSPTRTAPTTPSPMSSCWPGPTAHRTSTPATSSPTGTPGRPTGER